MENYCKVGLIALIVAAVGFLMGGPMASGFYIIAFGIMMVAVFLTVKSGKYEEKW